MQQLKDLVGAERSLERVCQAIHLSVVERHPQVVGALHITCADEAEHECVCAFERGFVKYMLPPLKFAQQSAFRIANLGGRYDWGAVRIAEQNYAEACREGQRKIIVVKVNSHVGVIEAPDAPTFGAMKRYGGESRTCGALHRLLGGDRRPYAVQLEELFISEGPDRLATLRDPQRVDPAVRFLYAALVSARLQARKVILDIQDYATASPTEFVVIPCVTINRPERDTEIVCGFYLAGADAGTGEAQYFGLGDDPAGYQHRFHNRRLLVWDEHVGSMREARNHRQLALEQWHELMRGRSVSVQDERLDRVRHETSRHTGPRHERAKIILPVLLTVLGEVAPVSAAVLLFAHGAAGIHHAFRIHRLAREMEGSHEARKILHEIRDKVDSLEPNQAEAMMELLSREYRA